MSRFDYYDIVNPPTGQGFGPTRSFWRLFDAGSERREPLAPVLPPVEQEGRRSRLSLISLPRSVTIGERIRFDK